MKTTIRTAAFKKGAPVAQTARAPDFESGGSQVRFLLHFHPEREGDM